MEENERVIVEQVRTLAGIPEFVEGLTGGLSPVELAGRLTQRSVQLMELMIALRERGPQDNAAALVAGSLAQVAIFLITLSAKVGVDLLAETVARVEAENKAQAGARPGATAAPNSHQAPN